MNQILQLQARLQQPEICVDELFRDYQQAIIHLLDENEDQPQLWLISEDFFEIRYLVRYRMFTEFIERVDRSLAHLVAITSTFPTERS